jgi:hypothetical protein
MIQLRAMFPQTITEMAGTNKIIYHINVLLYILTGLGKKNFEDDPTE